MEFFAHTPPKEKPDLKPHFYQDHILDMLKFGEPLIDYVLSFSNLNTAEKLNLKSTLITAIMLHDLGKLDDGNQAILSGKSKGKLPIDHLDSGVLAASQMKNELLAWLIRGHHAPGLVSRKDEKMFARTLYTETNLKLEKFSLRGLRHNRDSQYREDYFEHLKLIGHTNKNIELYLERQKSSIGEWPHLPMELPESGLTTRLFLSCLVSADHESAASYSNVIEMPKFPFPEPRWQERLIALCNYVDNLPKPMNKDRAIDRNRLRAEFFESCKSGMLFNYKIVMCSAQVGLGKTTSVLAYILRKAIKDNASRIFIIAPFSNIIDQTVKVLRRAIILNGENAEEIVVAHHHKADFSSVEMRQYATSWQAPIVVTTAVQFFETLASADPSKLKKLNAISGACIFIDESHACLPVQLLKIAWNWLHLLSIDWGCNIVFSSGSIVKFWNDDFLTAGNVNLPDIFPKDLQSRATQLESKRIEFKQIDQPLTLDQLIQLIKSRDKSNISSKEKGQCVLIIMNTVQSAAIVAHYLADEINDLNQGLEQKIVLHLSTALAPADRDRILKEIVRRQSQGEWDEKLWYLVATSCVESGVDLDFSIGFRERSSVNSFLQVAGRINRHSKRKTGILYDFKVYADGKLVHHPEFKESAVVFDDMWQALNSSDIDLPKLCTTALRKEFSRFPAKKEFSEEIIQNEQKNNFQQVMDKFKVINTDTVTVIIDKDIVNKMELGIPVSWQHIQQHSVQIWASKLRNLKLKPISSKDRVYSWIDTYEYDPNFLGIMGGLIKIRTVLIDSGGVI